MPQHALILWFCPHECFLNLFFFFFDKERVKFKLFDQIDRICINETSGGRLS